MSGTNSRLMIVLLLGVAIAGWLAYSSRQPVADLAAGLQSVENADEVGVDRIEQALNRSGKTDEATVLRCAWLARYSRYEEVLRRLPNRLADGPLRRHALRLVGESLFRLGDLQQAEVALTTLAAEFPDEIESHRLLAVMYYDLGSNELALKALGQVQRLAPSDYRPHHLAGIILADGEDYQEATKQLRLALEKAPAGETQSTIRRELAKSLIRIREYRKAVELLEADGESDERSAMLAECYWLLGEKRRAAEIVDGTLKLRNDNLPLLRVKGRLLEDDGKIEEAIGVLRQILAAEPYDVESRYLLVQLLGVRGLTAERDQEQKEYLRYRALQDRLIGLNLKASANPDDVELRQELVEVCRALGRTQLAAMWQRAADFGEQRRQQRKTADQAAEVKSKQTQP